MMMVMMMMMMMIMIMMMMMTMMKMRYGNLQANDDQNHVRDNDGHDDHKHTDNTMSVILIFITPVVTNGMRGHG